MQWTGLLVIGIAIVAGWISPSIAGAMEQNEAKASENTGLVSLKAEGDINTVWNRLLEELKAINAPIFATIDHKENAISAGLTMPGARVVIFGNPAVGTALMQVAPAAALDLPLKILIWESSEGTMLTWNDPAWIASRHGADPLLPVIGKMRVMLQKLTENAAKPQ